MHSGREKRGLVRAEEERRIKRRWGVNIGDFGLSGESIERKEIVSFSGSGKRGSGKQLRRNEIGNGDVARGSGKDTVSGSGEDGVELEKEIVYGEDKSASGNGGNIVSSTTSGFRSGKQFYPSSLRLCADVLAKRKAKVTDWSSLPDDILMQIFMCLHQFSDHVAMRSICAHWRSFFLLRNAIPPKIHSSPMPQLLLSLYNPIPNPRKLVLFYDIYDDKIRHIPLPCFSGNYCIGSSQGWLVLLKYNSPSMSIFNLFTMVSIELPPITTFPDVFGFDLSNIGKEFSITYNVTATFPNLSNPILFFGLEMILRTFISKVVLAPNPTSTNFTAMAIFGYDMYKRIAICKSGHNKWTLIHHKGIFSPGDFLHGGNVKENLLDLLVKDIIHHKGNFYALTFNNLYQIYSLDSHDVFQPLARLLVKAPKASIVGGERYLAELSGNLILIYRNKNIVHKTTGFQLFRLDFENFLHKWLPVDRFGNQSLFISAKSVLASLASDSPRGKASCIYFTSESKKHDFGIFSLERNIVEPYRSPHQSSLPIWFSPSFS